MRGMLENCPQCGSVEIEVVTITDVGSQDVCQPCGFTANYVRFSPCNHCCPEVYGVCPYEDCNGTPTPDLCATTGRGARGMAGAV